MTVTAWWASDAAVAQDDDPACVGVCTIARASEAVANDYRLVARGRIRRSGRSDRAAGRHADAGGRVLEVEVSVVAELRCLVVQGGAHLVEYPHCMFA